VLGACFSVLAALGLLRFPDLYTRLHAATKAGTGRRGFCAAGGRVRFIRPVGFAARAGRHCVIILTSHSWRTFLARAAYLSGDRPSNITVVNELENEKQA